MSEVKVNKISPRSGTDVQLGDSGDTITVPTGATFDASNATTTLPATVVTTDGSQTLTNKTIDASQLTGTITPSDNTVSLAKLTATGTKDATTFLRGDNTFAEPSGGGITEADQWRITTNISINGDVDFSTNWEQADTDGAGYIGTGMTQSSGIFTFPSTGIWKIEANAFTQKNAYVNYTGLILQTTLDNSTYSTAASTYQTLDNDGTQNNYTNLNCNFIFDVTNTTNCKIKLLGSTSGSTTYFGSTGANYTYLTFIRLGDT